MIIILPFTLLQNFLHLIFFLNTLGYNSNISFDNSFESKSEIRIDDENYLKRMQRNAPNSKYEENFKIGDFVIVKKDFDKNIKTKKSKLESFYENQLGVIIEIINDDVSIVKMNVCDKRFFIHNLKKLITQNIKYSLTDILFFKLMCFI
ncbi:hypothetical protein DMUE_5193 [Dictyocoela muelleri]|nr:hypothetical protein DMUE_5193 [Dictyocoela muelleri]